MDTLVSDDIDLLRADALQQSVTRGRPFHHSDLPPRSLSSTLTSDDTRVPIYQVPPPQPRVYRSSSPVATRLPFEENANDSFEPDPMNTDSEDLDDVDFWGRMSSKEKAKHDRERARMEGVDYTDDGDDDEDEVMDDEDGDEDGFQDEDDVEEVDHMEIFGHR